MLPAASRDVELVQDDTTPPELKEVIERAAKINFDELLPMRNAYIADLGAGRPVTISRGEWLKTGCSRFAKHVPVQRLL